MKNGMKYKILMIAGVIAFIASFVATKYELIAIAGGLRGFGLVAAVLGYAKLHSLQDQIEDADERNIAIRGKAAYISNLVTLAALGVCVCVYMQREESVSLVFLAVFCLQGLVTSIATAVYRRKM